MSLCKPRCLVSACLIGLCTRYDGCSKSNLPCLQQLNHYDWIPVCPEQLGGLPTPRIAADLIGGDGFAVLDGTARVIDRGGVDRTANFLRGAHMVLDIAQRCQIDCCLFKERSPSCGLSPLAGVTTGLLLRCGFRIINF